MKILFAEDDMKLGRLAVYMLRKECHTTDWVTSGPDALAYAESGCYDLIILDWLMPGKDGVSVCKELRASGFDKGILMLTAKDALPDRVEGLDAGADDYMSKPFEFEELFARIRSLSRRSARPRSEALIEIAPYTLNLTEHAFYRAGERIELTVKEYQLLELFMQNAGKVLSRHMLLSRIWGLDADVTSNSLDALVKLLRKKLEPDDRLQIRNVRGVGYRLEASDV